MESNKSNQTELHTGAITIKSRDGQPLTSDDWEGGQQIDRARQALNQTIEAEESQRAQRLGLIAGLKRAMKLIATQFYAEVARRNRKK